MVTGSLLFTLHNATGLKGQLFDTLDPYVIMALGTQRMRSNVAKDKGKSPKFEQTFTFIYNNEPTMKVQVMDKDTSSSDDILGVGELSLTAVQATGKFSGHIPLTTMKGKPGGSVGCTVVIQASQVNHNQHQGAYPMQGSMPQMQGGYGMPQQNMMGTMQGGYPMQGSMPPMQGGYPMQGSMPPMQGGYPMQGSMPPMQGGYPMQGSMPPMQGGYPMQGSVPPMQGGYPPQQGGYPMQGSMPPIQGGYGMNGSMPPMGGYPPQGGYPPSYH